MTTTTVPSVTHPANREHRALIIVDPQADFAEGGSLEVAGGHAVSERIATYVRAHSGAYDLVVVTRDWHPVTLPGHFSDNPDFVDSWPGHCIQNTPGASFLPAIAALLAEDLITVIVSKGQSSAAYSGFEGNDGNGDPLHATLVAAGIIGVDVCGIATSHCVRATAAGARTLGYDVAVITDLSVGVTAELAQAALTELDAAGVTITTSGNQP